MSGPYSRQVEDLSSHGCRVGDVLLRATIHLRVQLREWRALSELKLSKRTSNVHQYEPTRSTTSSNSKTEKQAWPRHCRVLLYRSFLAGRQHRLMPETFSSPVTRHALCCTSASTACIPAELYHICRADISSGSHMPRFFC